MNILKERTRLIFTDFNEAEKRYLEDMVASMDNVYMYYDPDGLKLGMPTGMEKQVREVFKKAKFTDRSKYYWDYARIQPVEHNAQPRNQLQIDFIDFVLKNAKDKRKLAGILSPGQGKSEPLYANIPTPNGFVKMGDLSPGDLVIGGDGNPTVILNIFPQGLQNVYELTFEDGRTVRCSEDHLWMVSWESNHQMYISVIDTNEIIQNNRMKHYLIPSFPNVGIENVNKLSSMKYEMMEIVNIKFIGKEECQCIMVDNKDHLYLTDDFIVTHNTFMACYSAIRTGLRTLIIVPTSGIKVQWGETLTGMFNVPPERVKVVNKPTDFINVKEDFVVVSHASLASINKRYDLEKIMKANKFGIKVIDEVQMFFKNIVIIDSNSNIANNWYLTGTFGRSGETENKIYQEMFGDLAIFREKEKKPTIFNRKPGNVYGMKPHMHCKMIWMKSGLSKEEIKKVTSSMRYSEREGKWMRFGISIPAYTELVIPPDGTMTKFLQTVLEVVKMAEREVKYGKTLILCATISSVNVVAGYVEKLFPDKKIGTINSSNSKAVNDQTKAECDILVSTVQSAGTGFDVKGLSKLIVVQAFKSWILTDQVSGRLRRRDDGKDTYMWDIVDAQIPQLRAWANARADVLKRKSKTFKVVDM